jgi:hypothetical protein
MPPRLAHPEVLITSVEDFVEKLKKTENYASFAMQILFAQKERKRLRDKDTRRRAAKAAEAQAAFDANAATQPL